MKLNKTFNLQIGGFILERGTYTCKRERGGAIRVGGGA